ncbi:hypothetical protein A7985_05465 [Pseudoalteromonas luteoviolacea]|uniref:Uncharacterized protein n=1 Tax=Pseudoalteromonas luteoviolacea TaxID=43657 RepID=A0A1C0TVQ6_9GAMM|nr:hypothetical protein [Pseudoalteromonas luteoviolacea]OCQ23389.1 hypothetical protein A7985_05465 [Pseudoalteromonas luteoviolacea]
MVSELFKSLDDWLYEFDDRYPFWQVWLVILFLSLIFASTFTVFLVKQELANRLGAWGSALGGIITFVAAVLAFYQYMFYVRDRAIEEKTELVTGPVSELRKLKFDLEGSMWTAVTLYIYDKKEIELTPKEMADAVLKVEELKNNISTQFEKSLSLLDRVNVKNSYNSNKNNRLKVECKSMIEKVVVDLQIVINLLYKYQGKDLLLGNFGIKPIDKLSYYESLEAAAQFALKDDAIYIYGSAFELIGFREYLARFDESVESLTKVS